ncbi:MAG TPA: DUF4160 domain-containing protein [Candidatus Binatia bacterium]|nr:DUF4160 domain-containing protein [Candidatus Binatia bacterium]
MGKPNRFWPSIWPADRLKVEKPPHVHVGRDELLAKFWLQPLALARNFGYPPRELRRIRALIEENREKLLEAWHGHIGS